MSIDRIFDSLVGGRRYHHMVAGQVVPNFNLSPVIVVNGLMAVISQKGAQKNIIIEGVLLSTHNICFGREIRKLFFCYSLLTKVLNLDTLYYGH